MSTNSDYMEAHHCRLKRLGIQGKLILWIISFLRRVLRAVQFLIDYDEVRIKSQPKEEISRSNVYAKYTSLQSMEY